VYVSIDVDSLDPAFAPGVSHFEPGGFSFAMFSTSSMASKVILLLQMWLN
jgi:arginase